MSDTSVIFVDRVLNPVEALTKGGELVEYGGALYLTTHGQQEGDETPPFDAELTVYKSIDGGLTWAAQDVASRPSGVSIWACTQDGSLLVFFYQDTPGNSTGDVLQVAFDMATDTWSTAIAGGPTASVISHAATIESGKYIFTYYGVPSGSTTAFMWGIYDSGAFTSSGNVISSGAHLGDTYGRVLLDPTYAHFGYVRNVGFTGAKSVYHRALNLSDLTTLGSEQTIYTPTPSFAPMRLHIPVYWAAAAAIVFGFGWYYATSSTNSRRPAILIANAEEQTPTWPAPLAIAFDPGNTPAGGTVVGTGTVIGADGNLRMVWHNGVGVPGQDHSIDPFGDVLYRNVDPDTRTLIDANDIRFFNYGLHPVLPEPGEASASTPGFAFLPIGLIPSAANEHGFAVSGSYTLGVPEVEDAGFQATACFIGLIAAVRNFSHLGGFYTRKAG
jgi:hypothetical protein